VISWEGSFMYRRLLTVGKMLCITLTNSFIVNFHPNITSSSQILIKRNQRVQKRLRYRIKLYEGTSSISLPCKCLFVSRYLKIALSKFRHSKKRLDSEQKIRLSFRFPKPILTGYTLVVSIVPFKLALHAKDLYLAKCQQFYWLSSRWKFRLLCAMRLEKVRSGLCRDSEEKRETASHDCSTTQMAV